MSAFALYVGAQVRFENKRHTVTDVYFNGPCAPYAALQCIDHERTYCEARHGKVSWHSLQWVEPEARDERKPSVQILLKGEPVGVQR